MTITAGTPQSIKIGMFVSPHLPTNNNALVQTKCRIRNGRVTLVRQQCQVEPRANGILMTKQASGTAKINALMGHL
jgi:hypothetical protein